MNWTSFAGRGATREGSGAPTPQPSAGRDARDATAPAAAAAGQRQPVFLLGSHKSGSSLLRSLLDGHPDLAVLPKETHLFQFTDHWVDYRRRRNLPRGLEGDALVERMLAQIREDTRPGNPYADAPDFAYRMEVLEPRLRALDPSDMPAFFLGYMRAAYEASAGVPPADGAAVVEKSVEHAEFAYVLAHYFPGARFVHIVRNPYATVVAVRRMLQRKDGRFPYLWPMACSLHNSYHHLFTNRLAVPNYLCIRFEDLVGDIAATMRQVASFLGIDYQERLTRPTSLGEHWQGNSTSNEAFGGISRKPLEAWKEQVTDYEIALANMVGSAVLEAFDYPRLEPRHPHRWIPGERPRTYVANRMALSIGI
jgi:hypothetical protein